MHIDHRLEDITNIRLLMFSGIYIYIAKIGIKYSENGVWLLLPPVSDLVPISLLLCPVWGLLFP